MVIRPSRSPAVGTRSAVTLLATVLATLAMPLAVAAGDPGDTTYDLYNVASAYTTVPNGVFTYFESTSELDPSTYQSVTNPGGSGDYTGFVGSDSGVPVFFTNHGSADFSSATDVVPAHTLFGHPGSSRQAVIAFAIPGGGAGTVSGTARISTDDQASRSDGINVYLFATDASGSVIGTKPLPTYRGGLPSSTATLTLPPTALPAGGHVYLTFDKNSYYDYDGTGIDYDVTVSGQPATALPEAGMAVLLPVAALGTTAAVMTRRRRRRDMS